MLLSQLNATEQVLSSFSVEEFEVYQNLVKADKFSLMPWQKNASQKANQMRDFLLIKLEVKENAYFSQTELTAKGGEQDAYSVKIWAPTAAPTNPQHFFAFVLRL